MGMDAVQKLAELVKNAEIIDISMVSVGIGNKEADVLIQALAVRASIKKLNLSSVEGVLKNKITSEGV